MLGTFREFVIDEIKAPLESTLISIAKKFRGKIGEMRKDNTTQPLTHVLIDLKKEFFEHYCNNSKKELLDSGIDMLTWEVEHDPHYRWIFNWFYTKLKEEEAKGNWWVHIEPFPQNKCWR